MNAEKFITGAPNGPRSSTWGPDETIAVLCQFSGIITKVDGTDVRLSDSVDFEKLSHGKCIYDNDIFFVVVPTSTWNGISQQLSKLVTNPDNLRKYTPGRSYQIPKENTLWKHFPDGTFRVMLKMSIGIDKNTNDFVDTVRWNQTEPVNQATHPFVIVTIAAWNNFQRLADEFGIRQELRKTRPLAVLIRDKFVYRMTQVQFEEHKKYMEQQ